MMRRPGFNKGDMVVIFHRSAVPTAGSSCFACGDCPVNGMYVVVIDTPEAAAREISYLCESCINTLKL